MISPIRLIWPQMMCYNNCNITYTIQYSKCSGLYINLRFQINVILNGIKTGRTVRNKHKRFQINVILNGIKTGYLDERLAEAFQINVILNGIKTIIGLSSISQWFQINVILNGIKTRADCVLCCYNVLD